MNNVSSSAADIVNQSQGLSIILPTFNESGSIKQVITALLDLTKYRPIEILIVDDDSI